MIRIQALAYMTVRIKQKWRNNSMSNLLKFNTVKADTFK